MQSQKNWYQPEDAAHIDTPALLVFPERVKANIQTAITMTGDAGRLRPHVKTHKSPEVTRLLLQAGIQKFKCATIAEAEMLGIEKARDVLLAYQPLGPKLARFVALIKKYPATTFSCLCDNEEAAKEQASLFEQAGLEVRVFVDLNTGMNRSGIKPGPGARKLYQLLHGLRSVIPAGLHAYDGHIRDTDIAVREKLCNDAFASVEQLKQELEADGIPVPAVIAGGSPTFPIHAKRKKVDCSPGTFVYWDKGYSESCPEQGFLPAAVLMTRIVSLPAPGKVCTDLGHKSVAAENEINRRIHFLNVNGLLPSGQSEEHLVLENKSGDVHETGEILFGLPYHICPTVALYERVIVIEQGRTAGEWKNIARDRKLSV